MKVHVETNLDFGWKVKEGEIEADSPNPHVRTVVYEGEVPLRGARPTLRSLLQKLSSEYSKGKISLIDPETGEVDREEYLVTVNGGAWEFLPQRLETELHAGDRVLVMLQLDMLGGG